MAANRRVRLLLDLGAWTWIAGGVGHAILVDLLGLHLANPLFRLDPDPGLYDAMRATTMSWGPLGSTTVFLAMSGFSLWVAVSCTCFGAFNLVLNRDDSLAATSRRRIAWLNLGLASCFTAIAATCFIWVPGVAGLLAIGLYGAASRELHRRVPKES